MSYLVLARKWRPQTFEDVIGQQHVTQTLANAIEQDRVAHAFLFTGSRGVGKTSTARIFAKALNCERGPTTNPCGVCSACIDITEGRSIDVLEVDGASNRGINEIRELREAVRYAPSRDRYKIYIIDEVHMLTMEAFNALLKTLEEPPAHAIFIFATTEPRKIPITILSRCQRYDFKRVSVRSLIEHLRKLAENESLQIDDGALSLIARHARGGVRDALSSLDQIIAFAGQNITEKKVAEVLGVASRELLLGLGEAVVQRDAEAALRVLEAADNEGQDLSQFSAAFLHHLRDLAIVAALKDPGSVTDLSDAELAVVRRQIAGIPVAHLQRLFQVFGEAAEKIQHTAFPKLNLEMSLLKLTAVEPLLPLQPILQKLEALERSLSGDRDISSQVFDRYHRLIEEAPAIYGQTLPLPASVSSVPPSRVQSDVQTAGVLRTSGRQSGMAPSKSAVEKSPLSEDPLGVPEEVLKAPTRTLGKIEEVQKPKSSLLQEFSPFAKEVKASSKSVDSESRTYKKGDDLEQDHWFKLVEMIRKINPILGGKLERAVLCEFAAASLEFWLSKKYVALVDEQDRALLKEIASKTNGQNVHIKIFSGALPPSQRQSLTEVHKRAYNKQLEMQRHQIETDPLLTDAMQVFGVVREQVSIQVTSK